MYSKPSMNSIYESNYSKNIQNKEIQQSTLMWNKAQNPMESGIIGYSSRFSTLENEKNTYDGVSSLSGENITFTHNNMTPFLKGNVTQNTHIENFQVDRLTGNDSLRINKKENECFFKPQKDNICGMQNNDNFYKSRINNFDTRHRNNEFPIPSIQVGPGINKGYTSSGSGGFQQADSLKYSIPIDIQKNKPITDQKSRNFKIPIQGTLKSIDKRGVVGDIIKNKPETYYEKTPDMLFTTTGSQIKQTSRAVQNLLPTNRPESHIEYKGISSDISIKSKLEDDYGKSKILVYDNERNITQSRTVVSNITSTVKAIVSPIYDTLKNSIKEYLIDAPRPSGNMQTSMAERATVYDPINHIMKTTIKETTIHDNDKLNLKGEDGTYSTLHDGVKTTIKETTVHDNDKLNLKGEDGTYSTLHDGVKTTIKETTVHDNDTLNLKGEDGTYSTIQDGVKTTIKETTIHDGETLNLKGEEGTYSTLNDLLKTTTKESTPTYDILRNIGASTYKVTVYNSDIVLKTTNKQTILESNYGFLGGIIENLFGGYLSSNPEAKNTQKQFSHIDYNGTGNSIAKKFTSKESAYNAEIDGTREALNIASAHIPNAGGKFTNIDKKNVNFTSEKLPEDSITTRIVGNVNKIYTDGPIINKCATTKELEQLNSFENRLDPTMISSLKSNPFSHNITKNNNCI
jgi:hypothetical protein